jgi:hypothetical protein
VGEAGGSTREINVSAAKARYSQGGAASYGTLAALEPKSRQRLRKGVEKGNAKRMAVL